jgi:hypothetical protein
MEEGLGVYDYFLPCKLSGGVFVRFSCARTSVNIFDDVLFTLKLTQSGALSQYCMAWQRAMRYRYASEAPEFPCCWVTDISLVTGQRCVICADVFLVG